MGAELRREAAHHDTEWGRPAHDDRHLFEMLLLEGAQAGLSWSTVLLRLFRHLSMGLGEGRPQREPPGARRSAAPVAGAAVEVRPSWACRPRRRPHGPECCPGPAGAAPAGACGSPDLSAGAGPPA
ncbi:DNA-3-methyladenine glycosylase I [Streptomyces antimycoticus]|uniref:DNA-3-methyladenine glycosylase I n=1 Tax=Streptomyces antimycoticus TaxID=68175 RepID=UPI0036E66BBF